MASPENSRGKYLKSLNNHTKKLNLRKIKKIPCEAIPKKNKLNKNVLIK